MAQVNLQAVITARDQASSVMRGFSKSMQDAEEASGALLGALAAMGAGILFFANQSIKAYNAQARAEAELIQLHHRNTGATMEQTQSLMRLAEEIQAYGVVADDAIMMGQSQLATFKLSTDSIRKLTPAMTDMVAKQRGVNATGEDFVNIGNLVGRVMEGNIGALTRYGVSFSEAQRAILEHGTESERAATLAEVLAQNYGGVNKALRDTPEGKIKALRDRLDDLQEILGEQLMNALVPVVDKLSHFLTEIEKAGGIVAYLNKIFEANKNVIYAVVGAIGFALIPTLFGMAKAALLAIAPLLSFIAIGALVGLAVKELVEHFGGWGAMMERLAPIISILKEVGGMLWDQLKNLWTVVKDGLLPALQEFWNNLQELWNIIEPKLIPILKFLGAIIAGVVVGALFAIIFAIKLVVAVITGLINAINWVIDMFLALVRTVVGAVKKIKETVTGIGDNIKNAFKDGIEWILDKVNAIVDAFKKVANFAGGVTGTIGRAFGGGRASGGPVHSGTSYLVGERGPEIFTPRTSGQIIPNHELGGGMVINNYNTFARDTDPIYFARELAFRLR